MAAMIRRIVVNAVEVCPCGSAVEDDVGTAPVVESGVEEPVGVDVTVAVIPVAGGVSVTAADESVGVSVAGARVSVMSPLAVASGFVGTGVSNGADPVAVGTVVEPLPVATLVWVGVCDGGAAFGIV